MIPVAAIIARANRIVHDYGTELGGCPEAGVLPESALPHPRPVIKTAIKVMIVNTGGRQPRDVLMAAYAYLSRFVPDGQAVSASDGSRDAAFAELDSEIADFAGRAASLASGRPAEQSVGEYLGLISELEQYILKVDARTVNIGSKP